MTAVWIELGSEFDKARRVMTSLLKGDVPGVVVIPKELLRIIPSSNSVGASSASSERFLVLAEASVPIEKISELLKKKLNKSAAPLPKTEYRLRYNDPLAPVIALQL